MAAYPELLILRHGETEWNVEGRMQGDLDSPLTAAGRAQARAQAALMRQWAGPDFIWYASPKGRALDTAEIAGDGVPVIPDKRLREIGMGSWTGRLRSEIASEAPQYFTDDAAPLAWYGHAPGGETLQALATRVADFLACLEAPSVLVTHGVTSRVLRCVALGLPVDRFARLDGGQGIAYRIGPEGYQRLSEAGAQPQSLPA